jgi:hypothetical protein
MPAGSRVIFGADLPQHVCHITGGVKAGESKTPRNQRTAKGIRQVRCPKLSGRGGHKALLILAQRTMPNGGWLSHPCLILVLPESSASLIPKPLNQLTRRNHAKVIYLPEISITLDRLQRLLQLCDAGP